MSDEGNPADERPASERLLDKVFRAIIRFRWLIVAFYALLSIPCARWALRVGNDSSLDHILVPTDPGYIKNREFEKVFGGGELAVLIIDADAPLSLPVLAKVDALERAIAKIEGVEASSVVTAYREARAGFDAKQEDVDKLTKFVGGSELFRKQGLVGPDFLTISLVLDAHDEDSRRSKVQAIDRAIAAHANGAPIRAVRRVGQPYVNVYFDDVTERSGPRHFGLFTAFAVVLTLLLFRSLRTLIAFLLSLGLCLAILLGYIGMTGGTFTIISPMVPMTVLITATATLVYLHARFVDHPPDVDVEEHRIYALSNKFLACTASIFAAIAGFAALLVSGIRPIREMGVWVAVGLAGTWLVVFTLFPALQKILGCPTNVKRKETAAWLRRLADRIPELTYRWRWPFVISALVLSAAGVVAIFGAGRWLEPMSPITEPIEYVSRDSVMYQDTKRARDVLPGLSITNVWLKGKDVLISDPAVLQGLNAFEQALAKEQGVGAVVGLPTFLRLIRYTSSGDDKWPTDEEEVDELAEVLEGLAMTQPRTVKRFIDRSMAQTQLVVLSHATEHKSFALLEERITHHWRTAVAAHPKLQKLELANVGLGPLQAKMSQEMVPTLTESFALTAGIIFVTFLLVFRSGAARIMTMLPSLFAILAMFLFMRVTAMSLNIATILIATTVLGTSENDQIHFFYHFLEGRRKGNVTHAMRHTFLVAGRAIFFATVINAGGFLAFAIAEMRPMRQFGTLTALALVLAALADFTALPSALWILFREKPAKPDEKPTGESTDTPPESEGAAGIAGR